MKKIIRSTLLLGFAKDKVTKSAQMKTSVGA